MKKLKDLFNKKHNEFLKDINTKYDNKGVKWIYTDKYVFRLDFKTMTIELMAEVKE
jgi:hypothetical protein